LQLKQAHVVRLETRSANIEGKGSVTQRDLVKNSLRMWPDRIIVGEVRSGETFDMLQTMNTGHDGSLTTVHANSPRDALMRVETMVAMANFDIPSEFIRCFISSAINVIIKVSRLSDGKRRLVSIQEITAFQQTRIDPDGSVRGVFKFQGVRPKFMDRFKAAGYVRPVQGDGGLMRQNDEHLHAGPAVLRYDHRGDRTAAAG